MAKMRQLLTGLVVVSLVGGSAGTAWAKKRPAPPTTPPARSSKLSPADRQVLKQFKKDHRQDRRVYVNGRITEGRQYLKSLDVKGTRKAYRAAIRAAKKEGDRQAVRELKVDRKGFSAEVQSTRADLNYHKTLKARVDGKRTTYAPLEGGEWKKIGNAAPKAARKYLRAMNKDTQKRIKIRKAIIKEAKGSGDALTVKALRFENKKDRQELNRVGRPALLRARGYRYVKEEDGGGFFDKFLSAHDPRNQAEGIAEGHKFGQ